MGEYLREYLSENLKDLFFSRDNCVAKKSSNKSIEFRKEGNLIYTNKHNDDSHIKILLLYTKSIAFAPDESEELALAYGNRSALLIHIQKYEECIIDIDRALSISKSDKLKEKLSSRRVLCLKLMDESKFKKNIELEFKKLSLLDMIPSKKVPCVAECLSLQYNEKYGKHMVANREIKPGEVIALEEAHVTFPLTNKIYLVCSYCLSQSWNGIPCESCVETVYCSENCKNKAWKEYHDIECFIIYNSLSLSKKPLHQSQLRVYKIGLRLFIKTVKSHGLKNVMQEVTTTDDKIFDGTFFCHKFKSCYSLSSDAPIEEDIVTRYFATVCIKLLSQYGSILPDESNSSFGLKEFTEKLLFKFFSIIHMNSFIFLGRDTDCVNHDDIENFINCDARGSVLFSCCSLFNHSCIPNAFGVNTEKSKMILFSNRLIREGEQIFINYYKGNISLEKSKHERQSLLKEKFNFVCDCLACSENWRLPSYPFENLEPKKKVFHKILAENAKFCKIHGIRQMLGDPETWDYDENALKQRINLIELICTKNRNDYDAYITSQTYVQHIDYILWELYGIKWNKMSNCSKRE